MSRSSWAIVSGSFVGAFMWAWTGQLWLWVLALGIAGLFELSGAWMDHVRRRHSFMVESAVERERRTKREWEMDRWKMG